MQISCPEHPVAHRACYDRKTGILRTVATSLLCTVAAMLATGVSANAQDTLPAPLELQIPASAAIRKAGNQVEGITLSGEAAVPQLTLLQPVGGTYSLTFWMKAADSPMLIEKAFSQQTPVTIVDFAPRVRNNADQRMVLRVSGGGISATEQNAGSWKSLSGITPRVTPDKWQFVAYVRTPQAGTLYIDGNRVQRTSVATAPHDQLQSLAFGNFNQNRLLGGQIAEPRIYGEALSDAQIRALALKQPE